jgi:hypothetical protein
MSIAAISTAIPIVAASAVTSRTSKSSANQASAAPASPKPAAPSAPAAAAASNPALAALQEATETTAQTAKEAGGGDHQAQRLLAKAAASRRALEGTTPVKASIRPLVAASSGPTTGTRINIKA